MADEKTYVFDSASRNDIPLAYALNNNGWGNNGFGLGGEIFLSAFFVFIKIIYIFVI